MDQAWYGEHEALIPIDATRLLEEQLPPRALGHAIEWAASQREELTVDWGARRKAGSR